MRIKPFSFYSCFSDYIYLTFTSILHSRTKNLILIPYEYLFLCNFKKMKSLLKPLLWHKLKFSNPYIFATWWCKPLIFQIWSNSIHNLKYRRSTPLGGKDVGIRKSKFVTKTQFHVFKWNYMPEARIKKVSILSLICIIKNNNVELIHFWYFPKGIFPSGNFQKVFSHMTTYFPIWQLIFPYGNLFSHMATYFPIWQLPKCAIYKALGPLVFLAAVLGNCIFIYIVKHSCTHAGSWWPDPIRVQSCVCCLFRTNRNSMAVTSIFLSISLSN